MKCETHIVHWSQIAKRGLNYLLPIIWSWIKIGCTYKSLLVSDTYLACLLNNNYINALAKFQCSIHNLRIETCRRDRIESVWWHNDQLFVFWYSRAMAMKPVINFI